MSERGLTQDVAYAIDALRRDLAPYFGTFSVPVEVVFPAANTVRDIAHGLKEVPKGYHIVWADGLVHAEPGRLWTKDLAYMRATAVNVHATIVFFTLREVRGEL
jgi:hypothetical protein